MSAKEEFSGLVKTVLVFIMVVALMFALAAAIGMGA